VLFYASEKDLMPNDPRLAWRNWISGDLEIRSVPGGDSGQMLREPHVGTLARHVMACIELANLERA
jgi:thioesterase domain-containing protein